ncbi:MAG: hypothetical protein ACYC4N_30020 [Pirellulaceae bacterium]
MHGSFLNSVRRSALFRWVVGIRLNHKPQRQSQNGSHWDSVNCRFADSREQDGSDSSHQCPGNHAPANRFDDISTQYAAKQCPDNGKKDPAIEFPHDQQTDHEPDYRPNEDADCDPNESSSSSSVTLSDVHGFLLPLAGFSP